jgi:CHASE2 domain-containing sensor protein
VNWCPHRSIEQLTAKTWNRNLRHGSDRDPFRETTVAFVTSLAVAFFLASMLAAATLIGFPPMKGLKALDDSLAQLLWEPLPPVPKKVGEVTPIYFVDIDNQTIDGYAQGKPKGSSRFVGKSTPRDLVADLLERVRRANPAVVVLDIDLRDPQPGLGDGKLRKELSRKELRRGESLPLVLIPRTIYPAELTSCSNSNRTMETPHARAFPTIVEDAIDPERPPRIKFVHPYLELDWLGDVRGICPSLILPTPLPSGTASLHLNALSVEAVQNTRSNSHRWWFLEEHANGKIQRVQFRVRGDLKNRPYVAPNTDAGPKDRVLYQRLSASTVLEKEWSLPAAMAGAIVIIGTSHIGSEESHSTPLGQMPGPVVHANAMLQLQIGPVTEMPSWIQVVIEIILCIGLAFIHARVYVYNVARARSEGLRGIVHHVRYFAVASILTLVITLIYYYFIVPNMVHDAVAVLGPIVVVCAELLYEAVNIIDTIIHKWGGGIVNTLKNSRIK